MNIPENLVALDPSTHPAETEELVVSDSVAPEDLRRLLASLIEEDCVHTWRNLGPGATCDELLRWENERRPTILFFFHLKRGGTTRMVAASAVADRVTRDFPHTGFPVLGRCCILPEYRNQGYYRQILQHRLEYCRSEYGKGLNAIHLGAVNDRISRVITNHGLPGWPRFTHLGEEELSLGEGVRNVGAYILFQPEFLRRVQATLVGRDAPPGVVKLRNALARTESSDLRDLGLLVQEAVAEARQVGWYDARDSRDIEKLLLFCRSVPLVGLR